MNKSVILVVAAGGIVALLVALMSQAMFDRGPEEVATVQQQPQIEMVELLVASGNLAKGTTLDSSDTIWVEWPKEAIFEGAITRQQDDESASKPEGRLRRDVADGEPVTQTVMLSSTNHNFIAVSLPKGKRAMALNVNPASSAGGFVMPGDFVDIIMTYEVRLPASEEIRDAAQTVIGRNAAETILKNIQIMAVDQAIDTDEEAKLARTVTVAVDGREAETLALAVAMGELSIVLRGLGDGDDTVNPQDKKPVMTDRRLSGVMQELLSDQNNTGLGLRNVRIYHGTQLGAVSVSSNP